MSLSFLPPRAPSPNTPNRQSTLERPRATTPGGSVAGLAYLQQHKAVHQAAETKPPSPRPASTPGATSQALESPKFGFDRYVQEGLSAAGGRTISGGDRKSGAVYPSGPYKGMTQGQAIEAMRKQYAAMDPAQRATYEAGAEGRDVMSATERGKVQNHHAAKERAVGLDYLRPRNEREIVAGERVGTHDEAFAPPETGERNSLPPTIGSSDEMGMDTPGLGYLRSRSAVAERSGAAGRGRSAVATAKAKQQATKIADTRRRESRIAKMRDEQQRSPASLMASLGAGSGAVKASP